jgi:glutathione S-transferase
VELYFSPMACSMATRIAIYEAGASASFVEVDPRTKRTLAGGDDFRAIHPLGLVPAIRTDDGDVLTENAAVLQYVASRFPEARLAPDDADQRVRLQQWLCFIGTELHKGLFAPLLDRRAPDAVKTYALDKGQSRLAYVEAHLTGRDYLLDDFSVADAYLVTVLTWTQVTPIDMARYPALSAYGSRLRKRPSVARAMAEERELYIAELARHQA